MSESLLITTARALAQHSAKTPRPWVRVDVALDADTPREIVKTGTESWASRIIALYQRTAHEAVNLLLVPQRNGASFLGDLSSQASLAALCLPGTHESLALHGWPVSTCQSAGSTIAKQLNDGIRYLDIRLVPKGDLGRERLLAYHGLTNERIEFEEVLQQCWTFLDSDEGQRETIVMSLKQESGEQPIFIRTLFESYVKSTSLLDRRSPSRWFLENRIPRLGEVRGKIAMLSRFVIDKTYGYPGGISPPIWPNSFKGIFEYTLPTGQIVKTQDWYDIHSLRFLPTKAALIERLCREGGQSTRDLALNYCNASSFPLALPPAVAKGFLGTKGSCSKAATDSTLSASLGLAVHGIDVRLRDYVAMLLHNGTTGKTGLGHDAKQAVPRAAIEGLRVTFALDYYDFVPDLVPLLIEANYG